MKTKNIITFLTVLFLTTSTLFAGKPGIKGKILDSLDESPVSFANVILMKQDSTYITGVSSNPDGYFEIKNPEEENYILSVSYLGYETAYIPVTSSGRTDTIQILLKQNIIQLNEVIVQARSIIIKDDRKVILPSEELIKTSTDGMDVIRKMQLPRIMVDPVSGEISMSGNGEIQLRINGVQVTNAEIASIPPEDILRIEYLDDPGARYGKADAVIDYITRHKESGGNINGMFFNGGGHKKVSLDNRLSLKYNYRKSEFSANAMFIKRKQNWTREYDEKLIFPDHDLHRIEVGEPTLFNKAVFSSNLNYSLIEKNNYFFNAQLRYTHNKQL